MQKFSGQQCSLALGVFGPLVLEPTRSVLNTRLTVLLLLLMAGGKEEPILWPPITIFPSEVEPQLFSIKVVPSPSVIVRWSQIQADSYWMLKAVNSKERISPSSTWIVSVFSRLSGYLPGKLGEVTTPVQRVFHNDLHTF